MFSVLFHSDIKKDLKKIDKKDIGEIIESMDYKLGSKPEFFGRPLRGTLKGYWKLRLGKYRAVYKITEKEVIVLAVLKRSEVYQHFLRLNRE